MATPTREQETATPPQGRRIGRAVIAAAVVGALVVAVGLFWYFNRTIPEEVSLSDAVSSVADQGDDSVTDDGDAGGTDDSELPPTTLSTVPGTEAPPAEEAPPGDPTPGLDGTWTVDTTIGEFNFEAATSSFAGFRIEEELASIGSTTAVGRTPDVSGSLEIEGADILSVLVEADLTGIVTNDSRRDDRVQSALNTTENPVATFELTEPISLGSVPAEGEPVAVTAVGDLTINGITQQVEFPLEAQLTNGLIVVVGSIDITFADYDVEVPSARIVVSAEDHGILEVQLFFVM